MDYLGSMPDGLLPDLKASDTGGRRPSVILRRFMVKRFSGTILQ